MIAKIIVLDFLEEEVDSRLIKNFLLDMEKFTIQRIRVNVKIFFWKK